MFLPTTQLLILLSLIKKVTNNQIISLSIVEYNPYKTVKLNNHIKLYTIIPHILILELLNKNKYHSFHPHMLKIILLNTVYLLNTFKLTCAPNIKIKFWDICVYNAINYYALSAYLIICKDIDRAQTRYLKYKQ
jgi:hypothetical protein